jgi:hypothetical protein
MHTRILLYSHKLICRAHLTAPSPPPNSKAQHHLASRSKRWRYPSEGAEHISITLTSRHHPRATAHAVSPGQHCEQAHETTLAQQEHTFFPNSTLPLSSRRQQTNERRATTHARRITKSQEHTRYPHVFALWLLRITVQVVRSDDGIRTLALVSTERAMHVHYSLAFSPMATLRLSPNSRP